MTFTEEQIQVVGNPVKGPLNSLFKEMLNYNDMLLFYLPDW